MRLDLCSWPEVEAYLARSRGIILPLGSSEQHGPQGLIGTDSLCAEAIARGAGERAGALVAPVLPLGPAAFNTGFPGTVCVSARTFVELVSDVLESLWRGGFRLVYLLNGHGGCIAPARVAMLDLQARLPLRCVLRSWWELPGADALRQQLYGAREGLHGTPSEIAITQALFPGRAAGWGARPWRPLDADTIRDHAGDNHEGPERHRAAFPDGIVGSDPTLATPEHGRRLLQAAIEDAAADYARLLAA